MDTTTEAPINISYEVIPVKGFPTTFKHRLEAKEFRATMERFHPGDGPYTIVRITRQVVES